MIGIPFWGSPGGTSFNGLYDPFEAGMQALVGYRRLLASYPETSPLFRVRRSSDDAETDVYPESGSTTGLVDNTALKAWRDAAGAATLYLVKGYDQTGNSNHYTAPTTGTQPSIYTKTATLDIAAWSTDGTDDNILADVASASGAAKSFFVYCGDRGQASLSCVWEYGAGNLIGTASNAEYAQLLYDALPIGDLYLGSTSAGTNWARATTPGSTAFNGATMCIIKPTAGSGSALSLAFYSNGSARAMTSNDSGTKNSTANLPSAKYRLGCRSDGSLPADIDIYALAEFDSDVGATYGASMTAVVI